MRVNQSDDWEPPEEPHREPWELPELKEGYDVYGYDAEKARKGLFAVLLVFGVALILFAAFVIQSARQTNAEEKHRKATSQMLWRQ